MMGSRNALKTTQKLSEKAVLILCTVDSQIQKKIVFSILHEIHNKFSYCQDTLPNFIFLFVPHSVFRITNESMLA